jgi:hypothetical protein
MGTRDPKQTLTAVRTLGGYETKREQPNEAEVSVDVSDGSGEHVGTRTPRARG